MFEYMSTRPIRAHTVTWYEPNPMLLKISSKSIVYPEFTSWYVLNMKKLKKTMSRSLKSYSDNIRMHSDGFMVVHG